MSPTIGSVRAFAAALVIALAATPARADEPAPPAPEAPTPEAPVEAFAPVPPAPVAGIHVVKEADGWRLQIDGKPTLVRGVNWDYFPIGTNYSYSLWTQPDAFIKTALDNEMPLLKRMGVNAIRLYTGIPARWITYIHETYGIYTVLNHTVGRYGFTIDGAWVAT